MNKKRKGPLLGIIAAALAVVVVMGWFFVISPMLNPKPKPNIVLIIIDALRADKLGCYGDSMKLSPELDAIAREGVVFEDVISQCSWTRPSTASMLTGLYPRTTGIFKEKFDILHDKYLTLAEILKDNGYHTFGITSNPNLNSIFNFHQGFDQYRDSGATWTWMKKLDKKAEPESPGKKSQELPRSREVFNTVLEKAKKSGDGPFYVQINIMEVHSPFLIRDEYKGRFRDLPVKPVHYPYSIEKLRKLVCGTLAAIQQASLDVGSFIHELKTIPGWENTVFVITSDHGQGLNDHPDVHRTHTHGNVLYESNVRVPLIVYHPHDLKRYSQPLRIKNRARLLDLMPTILDYAGVPMPDGHQIHGLSLLPFITGSGTPPHMPDLFVCETRWRKVNKIAVYSAEKKYFENRDNWQGVNKREIQLKGTENGILTDLIGQETELAKKMKHFLYQWEKKYKSAKRHYPKGKISEKETDQLKALGYLN